MVAAGRGSTRAWLTAALVIACRPPAMPAASTEPAQRSEPVAPAPRDTWLVEYAGLLRADELARTAMRQDNYVDAAAYYERAAVLGDAVPSPTGVGLDVQAAVAWCRAGSLAPAERAVSRAVHRGYRDVRTLTTSEDLAPLRAREKFPELLEIAQDNARRFEASHRTVDDARLEFSDVARFWAAYDRAQATPDFDRQVRAFRDEYLAKGTPGLLDYHRLKTGSIEALVHRIREVPAYYAGIRETTLRAAAFEPQIRAGLRSLIELYPAAVVPDVTFVIGRLNGGGTAGSAGMLVGLDIWSWTPGVPLDGLSPGMQTLLQSFELEALPWVVLHEHVHALQSFAREETLLELALAEGSADFIAGLALPDAERPYYYRWGLAHEAEVWARFMAQMHDADTSDWIANMDSATDDWSGDLGYFVGARICEAYYARAADKQQAIADILFVADAPAFLERSGYAGR